MCHYSPPQQMLLLPPFLFGFLLLVPSSAWCFFFLLHRTCGSCYGDVKLLLFVCVDASSSSTWFLLRGKLSFFWCLLVIVITWMMPLLLVVATCYVSLLCFCWCLLRLSFFIVLIFFLIVLIFLCMCLWSMKKPIRINNPYGSYELSIHMGFFKKKLIFQFVKSLYGLAIHMTCIDWQSVWVFFIKKLIFIRKKVGKY